MKRIQILGADSAEGRLLADRVREALQQTGTEAQVVLVTDMDVITSFQVMATPALVVDGQVRLVGRVPPAERLEAMLR